MTDRPDSIDKRFVLVAMESVTVALPDQFPQISLVTIEGEERRLRFRIGINEGSAIAHAIAATQPARPSSIDLLAEVLTRHGIEIVAVRLVERIGSTFVAEIDLVSEGGREVLSARPSDALALALRQRISAPILVAEDLF